MNDMEYGPREIDDAAAADLAEERYERTLAALYEAAMRGAEEHHVRHLCVECGVSYADLERYVPPILRPKQKEVTGHSTDNWF